MFQCLLKTVCIFLLIHCRNHGQSAESQGVLSSPDELAGAISMASPGSVLGLADGIYEDIHIRFEAEGTVEAPVVLRAETPGGVVVTGDSRLTITGRHLVVQGFIFEKALGKCVVAFRGAENCRMTDCAFVGCGDPDSTFSHIITMRETSADNLVDHCYMEGNLSMGMGVIVAESDHENIGNRFAWNYFRDVVRRWHNGQEAIQIGQSFFSRSVSSKALVEYCFFERVNGDVEIISNKSSDNVYRYNTFRECRNAELVLRGANRVTVDGNFFLNGKGGVRVHGSGHRITNNYFENVDRAFFIQHGDQAYEPVVGCLIANNLIVNCTDYGIRLGAVRAKGDLDREHEFFRPPTGNVFRSNVIASSTGPLVSVDSERETVWECNLGWPTENARLGNVTAGLYIQDPHLIRVRGVWQLPAVGNLGPGKGFFPRSCGRPGPTLTHTGEQATDTGTAGEAFEGRRDWRPLEPVDVGPRWMMGDPEKARRVISH